MARRRGHGGGKLRAAGLPRRVSARSRRHRDLCGASGAAPPRHGLGSRPPRPRRPEWAGGTGTRFPRGARSACGRAGTAESPPHPAREPPDPAVSGPGAATAPRRVPPAGPPQPETLNPSWAGRWVLGPRGTPLARFCSGWMADSASEPSIGGRTGGQSSPSFPASRSVPSGPRGPRPRLVFLK